MSQRKQACQTTSGIDPLATRRIDPLCGSVAERVVHGVHRGDPRHCGATLTSLAQQCAGGNLWAPVGDPRPEFALAIMPAPAQARLGF
jgi:hypothetical protein